MSTLALGEEVNLSWSRNDLEQLVMNKIFEESLARASVPQWILCSLYTLSPSGRRVCWLGLGWVSTTHVSAVALSQVGTSLIPSYLVTFFVSGFAHG